MSETLCTACMGTGEIQKKWNLRLEKLHFATCGGVRNKDETRWASYKLV